MPKLSQPLIIPVTSFDALCEHAYATAASKGWHDRPLCDTTDDDGPHGIDHEAVLSKLALIHSEVSEATEDARVDRWKMTIDDNGKPEGFVVELADAVIRAMDTCEALGLDLEEALLAKMAYNETRPHRHGGKQA